MAVLCLLKYVRYSKIAHNLLLMHLLRRGRSIELSMRTKIRYSFTVISQVTAIDIYR